MACTKNIPPRNSSSLLPSCEFPCSGGTRWVCLSKTGGTTWMHVWKPWILDPLQTAEASMELHEEPNEHGWKGVQISFTTPLLRRSFPYYRLFFSFPSFFLCPFIFSVQGTSSFPPDPRFRVGLSILVRPAARSLLVPYTRRLSRDASKIVSGAGKEATRDEKNHRRCRLVQRHRMGWRGTGK